MKPRAFPCSIIALAMTAALAPASPAAAANVGFTGAVVNLCILTLTTPGLLAASADGKRLGSDEVGGAAATVTVVATGSNPTIAFTAPSLSAPNGAASGMTRTIAYTSPGGASQAFTAGASTYAMNRLLDVITVQGHVDSASGFASGAYTLSSTATCQQ